ncbi:hypothetical protein I308_105248 [Cryptococcus tetragattii IND107]|uniref:Uncharacterized protein n=1 Tax=Cryptococcus tetragattii IND107 TaxID=1296105 RepID=A0ABR3BMG4_9TREE
MTVCSAPGGAAEADDWELSGRKRVPKGAFPIFYYHTHALSISFPTFASSQRIFHESLDAYYPFYVYLYFRAHRLRLGRRAHLVIRQCDVRST